MKKIAFIFFFSLILNSCDDGNLNVDVIDFSDAKPQSCTNGIIYKLNQNESMLLQMPEGSITNEQSDTGIPTNYVIDNINYRVIYRAYNGVVSAETICNLIPPALPTVIDQWTATGGIIQIYTLQNSIKNPTTNSTSITGYTHNIKFKNITYLKNNGPQVYAEYDFGNYITTVLPLDLTFKSTAEQCTDSKQVYNFDSSASITIDNIDPALLLNEATPVNAPRTGLISNSINKFSYKVYQGGVLSQNYFCNTTTPTLPAIVQNWVGVEGIAGVSGIIEVQTETNGPNVFKHTISLKSVTLKKGNSSFNLGDSYLFGVLFLTK